MEVETGRDAAISTLAVEGYRSLRQVVVPLKRVNVVTGANGSGKSSLYRAMRLLAETSRNGAVAALAREGGLASTLLGRPRSRVEPIEVTRCRDPRHEPTSCPGWDQAGLRW